MHAGWLLAGTKEAGVLQALKNILLPKFMVLLPCELLDIFHMLKHNGVQGFSVQLLSDVLIKNTFSKGLLYYHYTVFHSVGGLK